MNMNRPLLSQSTAVLEPYRLPMEINQGHQEASRLWEELLPQQENRGKLRDLEIERNHENCERIQYA